MVTTAGAADDVEIATSLALDDQLCFALYAASNHMTRLFAPFLEKLGVTYPQYLVLVVLWERGPQGVGDLAHAAGIDHRARPADHACGVRLVGPGRSAGART